MDQSSIKLSANESKERVRPYTAVNPSQTTMSQTYNFGGLISLQDDNTVVKSIHQRYQSPSSLSPRSLQKLREPTQQTEEAVPYPYSLLRNPPRKERAAVSASNNLHVRLDVAEIEPPENHFVKEVKINQDEYQRFKKNFHQIVFDAVGNYIYTKPDVQPQDQKNQVESALGSIKTTSASLKRKLMHKTQNFKPKKIIDGLVKNAQDIAQMNPRRKAIMDIKAKSQQTLNLMINNMAKEKILYESKSTLAQTTQDMMNEVDNFIRENVVLKAELERERNYQMELQSINESLNFKNQVLQKELKETKDKLESLKRGSNDLEKFIPHYKILVKKFPEFSADKLIDKYEYMEQTCLDMTRKLGDMEEEKRTLERRLVQSSKEHSEKIADIMQSKSHNQFQDLRFVEGADAKDVQQYKEQYTHLFKKILQIYCQWTTQSKVLLPDKLDQGPRAGLNDPIEMLCNMEKIISISTSERLQAYLRKIIVSANLLQRKYLPEYVNEQFDPDKIYDRMIKLLDKLTAKISKLTKENKNLQRKAGINKQQESLTRLDDSLGDDSKTYLGIEPGKTSKESKIIR